jgi:hypothetical protein
MEIYSYMKRFGGKAQRGIRRALIVHGGEATTRQIWGWTHPREVNCATFGGAETLAEQSVARPRSLD